MRVVLFSIGVCGGAIAALLLLSGDAGVTGFEAAGRAERMDAARVGLSGDERRGQSERVAAGTEPRGDLLDAILVRADSAPVQVLDEALALDAALQTAALQRVATAWARRDPRAALAQAASLPEALRAGFESAVAREWAFIDPAGFLAYAETEGSIERLLAGLDVLLATDPERVFAIAARGLMSGSFAVETLYLNAVRAIVERDPSAAITRLLPLATGRQRDRVLRTIAQTYAATNADAAFAWAASLSPQSLEAVKGAILGVASEELLQAYELLVSFEDGRIPIGSLAGELVDAALAGRQTHEVLANLLAEGGDPEGEMLAYLMLRWLRLEPEGATAWMTAHKSSVTTRVAQVLASNLGLEDVRSAAALTRVIPQDAIDAWIRAVGMRYGQFDLDGGLDWLAQFEGRAGYAEAMTALLFGAADSEPARVAGLIEKASVPISSLPIWTVAPLLTEADPIAAIRWATSIENADTSRIATDIVARVWVGIDAPAAERWARAQPPGSARDRILAVAAQAAEAATGQE